MDYIALPSSIISFCIFYKLYLRSKPCSCLPHQMPAAVGFEKAIGHAVKVFGFALVVALNIITGRVPAASDKLAEPSLAFHQLADVACRA